MKRVIVLCLSLTFGAACDRQTDPPAVVEPSEPAVEPTEAAEPTVVQPADHPSIANLADEEWCGVAHADTVKLVEGIKTSMKRAGQDDSEYVAPPRETYVATCAKLPLAMQKCLVLAYSMQHKDECQATQDGLDQAARADYASLMGK